MSTVPPLAITWRQNSSLLSIDYSALCVGLSIGYEGPNLLEDWAWKKSWIISVVHAYVLADILLIFFVMLKWCPKRIICIKDNISRCRGFLNWIAFLLFIKMYNIHKCTPHTLQSKLAHDLFKAIMYTCSFLCAKVTRPVVIVFLI